MHRTQGPMSILDNVPTIVESIYLKALRSLQAYDRQTARLVFLILKYTSIFSKLEVDAILEYTNLRYPSDVVSICTDTLVPLDVGCKTISISHSSVKDFLLSGKSLRVEDLQCFAFSVRRDSLELALIFLRCIKTSEDGLFFHLAATKLLDCYRTACENSMASNNALDIPQELLDFFTSKDISAFSRRRKHDSGGFEWRRTDTDATPLHVALWNQCPLPATAIMRKDVRGIHTRVEDSTPLQKAARNGYVEVVRLLLHLGADPDADLG